MGVQSHRELVVWQKAMDLAVAVYRLASGFPRAEAFRLTDQITRAAASVPANIAEGSARGSPRDYAHFLAIAKGSLNEVDTFVVLARRLGYVTDEDTQPVLELATEVSKMLVALRARLR
jgi:four helix bundle protein